MQLGQFQLADGMGRLGTESAFEVLARAKEIERARPRGDQSRHRPARFPHARAHRGGGEEGARRRRTRIHARQRHPAPARGGRRGHRDAPRRRARSREHRRRARRQGDDVARDPDVRGKRRRDHVSQPRLPDLRIGDRVLGRAGGADPAARGQRLRVRRRRGAVADFPGDAADDPQQPGQPDGGRRTASRVRQARRRPRTPSPRDRAVGRDLFAPDLRRRRIHQPARIREPSRPPDRAGRLEQDPGR